MDDDGRDEEETLGQCDAAAHVASVDDGPHDPDSESEDDSTEPNVQDGNEQEERIHDADSNPFLRRSTQRRARRRKPQADFLVRATHKADHLGVALRRLSVILAMFAGTLVLFVMLRAQRVGCVAVCRLKREAGDVQPTGLWRW